MSFYSDLTTAMLTSYGEDTLVNGVKVKGSWADAEEKRVQLYLDQNEWRTPAYDVLLPASVVQAPISIKNDSELLRVKTGYKTVVRHIDPPDDGAGTAYITALVVLLKR